MAQNSRSISIANRSELSSSDLEKGLRSPLTFGLMLCGGVGALLFTVVYLVAGITRPSYDAWLQPISALSLGPGGWVQQVNFVLFGVLLVLASVGWYRLLTPDRNAIWFPLLQGIAGLCLIGAGVFAMDPFPGYPPGAAPAAATVHGMLHSLFAWVLILSLALGCYALAAHFWNVVHWRGWAVYSWITGALILIFWGAFVQGANGNVAGLAPIVGLTERLSAGSHALWVCALLVPLFFHKRSQRVST